MNRQRRKRVQEALDLMQQATEILAEVADEEEEAFDNLPEGIQESERGQQMEEVLDVLDGACESIGDAIAEIATACEI